MKKKLLFTTLFSINGTSLLWILLAILPLMGACEKEEKNMPEEIRTLAEAYQVISGEWQWEKTAIHYMGQENAIYETPETERKTIHYVFRKNGTAIKNESGIEPVHYKFEITSPEAGAFHLKLSPTDGSSTVSILRLIFYKENLILTNGIGITSYYTKTKSV